MDQDMSFHALKNQIKKDFNIIIKINFVFSSLALLYLLFLYPAKYVSSATLIHTGDEMSSAQSASGILGSFGIGNNAFSGSTAETEIIIQILNSDDFLKKLLNEEFYFDGFGYKVPLYKILLKSEEIEGNLEEIFDAKKALKNQVITSQKNRLTNVITIKVETFNANVSFELANEIINLLNITYNKIDKNRAIEKINFISSRIKDEKKSLLEVEKMFIDFKNNNKGIESPKLILKEQALQRDLVLQTSILTTLTQQLELAQIEQYDDINEVIVVSKPEISPYRDNPRRAIFVFCVIFGVFLSLTYSLYNLLQKKNK